MKIHELKIHIEFFGDVLSGVKAFEIRYNDRDFKAGDKLRLREILRDKPFELEYTGREITVDVIYITDFNQHDNYVVMGIRRMFPMQDGPDIHWDTAEKIYETYSELYGTGQSLKRLAERCGFGWAEIPLFINDLKRHRK